MRKYFVVGLACMLLALPACTPGEAGTESSTSSGSTEATGGSTGAPTTSGTTGEQCVAPPDDPNNKMAEFGAPCMADSECVTILGEGGVCLTDILGLYGLPCGYCTKLCDLPPGVGYVEDDMICGPGVTCIGADGYFEGCVVECTDNSQCPRDGYECRVMPQIGQPTDPKFCFMTDENML